MRATAVTALLWLVAVAVSVVQAQVQCTNLQDQGTFAFAGNMAQTSMTREACATLCYTFNFSLSAPSSDCNEPCTGVSTEMCRAANRMNINPGKLFRQTRSHRELPFCNTSLSIGARLDDLIGRLSLQEKAGLIGPDPVTSPCAFLDFGVKRLDIPPYLYLVETNTAVAFACIISQDMCATTFIGPTGLGAAFNRVVSTEMRAFNNLNWHRGGSVLQKIGLTGTDPCLSGECAAADVTGCQDGTDKNDAVSYAHLVVDVSFTLLSPLHCDFGQAAWHSTGTSPPLTSETPSTRAGNHCHVLVRQHQRRALVCEQHAAQRRHAERWRRYGARGDMLYHKRLLGAGCAAQPHNNPHSAQQHRIDECTICGFNPPVTAAASASAPMASMSSASGCAECHSTRVPNAIPPDATNCLNLCDGNLTSRALPIALPTGYYAKDHRCVPCTTCGMGTWASTSCSASSDAVCSPWTECKPGQKESVCLWQRRARPCVSCTLGMEYQPLSDRASCFPTSVCEEPFSETIPPTLTTDRLCSCDTLTCNLITQLFEEMVCAWPTDEQLDVVLDVCCSSQGDDGIRNTIRQMDADEARRSCPGCTDTCECSTGFILVYDADSANCCPCDGVTEFSPSIGGSKCEPIEECECGQEEVSAPTRSSDGVYRDCPAGPIDADSDGSTGCQMCAGHYTEAGSHGSCSSFTCHASTHDHHDSDPATPCNDVTDCASGFEEVQAMTLLISDCVSATSVLEGTYKAVSGQPGRALPPRHHSTFPRMAVSKCEFGTFQSQVPTLDSDRECTLECSGCSSDRYEIRACSALEDVQCAGCSACSPKHIHPARLRLARMTCRASMQSADGVRAHRLCHLITKCGPGEQRTRAPTSTSNTKCEPCPIGTTDHDRNPLTACQPCLYGHYVPAGSIGSCKQFLCPAGTVDLDRHNASTPCMPCQAGVDFAALSGQRDCTPVTECDLGYEEVVRPTIFTDRQCRRCIEALFYRDSNTDFSTRVCRPASLARLRRPHPPSARTVSARWARICPNNNTFISRPLMPTQNRICSPWMQCLSSEYELVAPSLVNDRECQRVRSCQHTEYEWSSLRCSHRACVPAYSVSLVFDAKFNVLAGRLSHRGAFEAALVQSINHDAGRVADSFCASTCARAHHRHCRLPQRGLYALLFSRSVSGDVTVMGSTASPCEADVSWTTRPFGNELKASDAVGSWTTTALLEETPAVLMVVVGVHAIATATTADEVVVVIVFAFLTSSSNGNEVGTVLLVGTHVLAIVGAMAGSSSCCNARQ
ncbi:hypothetical protein PTSG_12201 [Salpingoeca rosetta]|uniref:TNFR-Cys domain-containing protein n=1 Tax=Salpingoeca rosetta (strain ATCC 50818 / BSB-021) TaxID=946362 RepID=F2U859_SALR5|nr:uncharacterized protein PTSG_12201 [Salpingoeca rosetta]EGD72964.1 hypothetical protein PTSG_12201 [Salpingoeca rosetta]|eukprot:XP_004994786.1 hypothetical protein PTSG_12201 [Salpingoeca rosetta]